MNLLKPPVPNEDNPEELTYGFSFRESATPDGELPQHWYLVGRILDFEDAEDAKLDVKKQLSALTEDQRESANRLIGRLHNRVHTTLVGNCYEEKSQDYDKVLQVFVRANSAGQPLEFSDLLLATATAKWETLDARSEIHDFTESLNDIGNGYGFGKDFVLNGAKSYVRPGAGADGFVVSAKCGDGLGLFWIAAGTAGVDLKLERSTDGTDIGTLTLKNVKVAADNVVASAKVGAAAFERAFN
ncbi:MAG: hypothetical protein WCJ63_08785, partial [Actinomycetes bacterium]